MAQFSAPVSLPAKRAVLFSPHAIVADLVYRPTLGVELERVPL